jgi:hypothetical protein
MTATAIMFTNEGFALAADGNQVLTERSTFVPDFKVGETDCAQKIFSAEGRDFAVAYMVRGNVATERRTFDATIELQKEMASLVTRQFNGPGEFVKSAAGGLYRRMLSGIKDRRLPCFLGLEIPVVGYFNGGAILSASYLFSIWTISIYRASFTRWAIRI